MRADWRTRSVARARFARDEAAAAALHSIEMAASSAVIRKSLHCISACTFPVDGFCLKLPGSQLRIYGSQLGQAQLESEAVQRTASMKSGQAGRAKVVHLLSLQSVGVHAKSC